MWRSLAVAAVIVPLALPAAAQQQRTVATQQGPVVVDTVAQGLEHPWALAFLPDGRMLVTERAGRLRMISRDGKLSPPLQGVPKVQARGQGGLLDVALAPDFTASRTIYLSFAEPGRGGAGTAVARARLAENRIETVDVVFRQEPKVDGNLHFGSRLVFDRDGKLYVTLAERFKFDPAQDLSNHLGKIVRINADGSTPSDNPFVTQSNAKPEIWSYGHRNIQAATLHPRTGALWIAEMGPMGGDELTVPKAGVNYGWPLVSKGRHYDGRSIPDPDTRPDLGPSIYYWTPVIAPSGMTFYSGDMFPPWRDNLLIGGLVAQAIVRLSLDGEKVTGEERIALGARIRDVRQGPDGAVYALTDEDRGELLRLTPQEQSSQQRR